MNKDRIEREAKKLVVKNELDQNLQIRREAGFQTAFNRLVEYLSEVARLFSQHGVPMAITGDVKKGYRFRYEAGDRGFNIRTFGPSKAFETEDEDELSQGLEFFFQNPVEKPLVNKTQRIFFNPLDTSEWPWRSAGATRYDDQQMDAMIDLVLGTKISSD